MFKHLVGKGHIEFSTMRQQDALEFFQHLLSLVNQKERAFPINPFDPSRVFNFKMQEKYTCSQSNMVKYTQRNESFLSLSLPMHRMTNKGFTIGKLPFCSVLC